MKKYNVIGDIHGRSEWRNLVQEDAVNIFLGDYFDSYRQLDVSAEIENFEAICSYKQAHPETVMLLGNHDLHYLWNEHYSRYNEAHESEIRAHIQAHLKECVLAYGIDNRVLITHAGVTNDWLRLSGLEATSVNEVVDAMNALLAQDGDRLYTLCAFFCLEPNDWFGESATASPIWVRPQSLLDHAFGKDSVWQVVGHTQLDDIMQVERMIFCDCLGTRSASLVITVGDDGNPQFAIKGD